MRSLGARTDGMARRSPWCGGGRQPQALPSRRSVMIGALPSAAITAIERVRSFQEPLHAPRQVLLGEFDTPWPFLRVGFDGGQLGADKIGRAVL
jgi:hypothetical protein